MDCHGDILFIQAWFVHPDKPSPRQFCWHVHIVPPYCWRKLFDRVNIKGILSSSLTWPGAVTPKPSATNWGRQPSVILKSVLGEWQLQAISRSSASTSDGNHQRNSKHLGVHCLLDLHLQDHLDGCRLKYKPRQADCLWAEKSYEQKMQTKLISLLLVVLVWIWICATVRAFASVCVCESTRGTQIMVNVSHIFLSFSFIFLSTKTCYYFFFLAASCILLLKPFPGLH